jgi:hypothetical protein
VLLHHNIYQHIDTYTQSKKQEQKGHIEEHSSMCSCPLHAQLPATHRASSGVSCQDASSGCCSRKRRPLSRQPLANADTLSALTYKMSGASIDIMCAATCCAAACAIATRSTNEHEAATYLHHQWHCMSPRFAGARRRQLPLARGHKRGCGPT